MSKQPILAILLVLILLLSACAPGAASPERAEGPVDAPAASPTDGIAATATATAATPITSPTESPTEPAPAPRETAPSETAPAEDPAAVFVLFDRQAKMLRSYNIDGSLRFEAPTPGLEFPMSTTVSIFKDAVYYGADGIDKMLYRATASGTQDLGISIGKLTAFTVSPDEKWIAWSTLDFDVTPPTSHLWIKPLDSGKKDAQEIASYSQGSARYFSLVPLEWSADSGSLLFERQMAGIGGYILYGGGFSLYRYDIASGQITTYAAAEEERGGCLDSYRLDLEKIVFSCGKGSNQISIRSLKDNTETAIPMLPDQGTAGTSEFSPSGQWLAYAAARNSPEDEAGQVAVIPADLSQPPQVIYKVSQQRYPEVRGWLNEDTLLLTIVNYSEIRHTVMTINRDGTGAREIAAGEFIGWAK